jgi:hypothetical protein
MQQINSTQKNAKMLITGKTIKSFELIICLLLTSILSKNLIEGNDEEFSETLLIKPLSDGHLYAFFEFKTIWHKDLSHINWGLFLLIIIN